MPAILYIVASILVGAGLIFKLKPFWENRLKSLMQGNGLLSLPFLCLPSSYLIGTLVLSWLTYFGAVLFRHTGSPLRYANSLTFLLTAAFLLFLYFSDPSPWKKRFYNLRKYGISIHLTKIEWLVIIGSAVVWSFFIWRSLYMDNHVLHAGISAFSDFGAHLPVVRSFSQGQNFPAQYPHFPDGTIRYHFMFYFLAGNLEYLGFNLPWALNLPSVLSLVSFTMLLYALCVFITKKPAAGLLSCLLFTFRSSFAFFTYAFSFHHVRDFFHGVFNNLNADGKAREHIGNTLNESWGLWAQKVYVNQRHLAFAFGLMVLALILLLPLFMKRIHRLREMAFKKHAKGFLFYFKTLFFTKESWAVESYLPCVFSGLVLGLMAFWNGAVVIAALSVLFLMAILSMHRLEYLITAGITFILSLLQSILFIGSGAGAVSIRFKPGFLAASSGITDIAAYYIELLGLLPFILLGAFLLLPSWQRQSTKYTAALLFIAPLLFMKPPGNIFHVILLLCLGFLLYLAYQRKIPIQPESVWLIPVFAAPVILATTLQLTPDITVNHKYIIMAVLLLNIPVADLFTALFVTRRKTAWVLGVCLIFMLISTGLIDMITLYNLDKRSVAYNQKEPVQLWVESETNPEDIFLTHNMTHYGAPMSVLLAGRSIYSGYAYFTMTAGYDVTPRNRILSEIYSAEDPEQLKALALSEGIRYIVIEQQNRTTKDYTLNEDIFFETFPVAFEDPGKNIVIFSVKD